MQPVDIEEHAGGRRVVFAKDQPEYEPLPAIVFPEEGSVLTRWEPSDAERQALVQGGPLEVWIWTFGSPLQPIALLVHGVSYEEDAGASPG